MFLSSVIVASPYLPSVHNESIKEPGHLPLSWSHARQSWAAPPAQSHLCFQAFPLPASPAPLLSLGGLGFGLAALGAQGDPGC